LSRVDDVDRQLAQWTIQDSRSVLQDRLRAEGIPAAQVAKPEDRIEHDPATARWGLWPTVRHSEMGDVRVDGLPVHLSRTDWVMKRGAPCLGEHNRYVFGELLGLGEDELSGLAADGVI
jgi:crotonobetainyl-CoA:carnitine CoA-transferase CaiB-like acyl-CoA transferase